MKKNYQKGIFGALFAIMWMLPLTGYSQYTILRWGTGALGKNICWLTWGDILPANGLSAGQSITRTIQVGDLNITVVLDQIAFSGMAQAPGDPSNAKLIGYDVGSKATDGLYKMYSYHYLHGISAPIGLTPDLPGAGSGLKVNFRVTAYGTLHGQAVDLNMFFGPNEDGNEVGGAIDDYTQVTTNGSDWKLLAQKDWEHAKGSTLAKAVFTNAKKTVKIHVGGGNSAVFHTGKQAASSATPLETSIEMNCAAASSIAFGFLTWHDSGDALASYGMAVNKFPFNIQGGDPVGNTATITNYFSWNNDVNNTPRITPGTVPQTFNLYPSIGYVGADAESDGSGGPGALGDDYDGADEGIWPVPAEGLLFPLSGNTFSYNVPLFKNSADPTQAAYAMAWIDFNHDGIFGPEEYQSYVLTDNNLKKTATFTWDLTAIPYGAGYTYTRIRISYIDPTTIPDDPGTPIDERSIAILTEGETEDHYALLTSPDMVTGKVFNDGNGLADNAISGDGANADGLWVIAVDKNGKVAAASQVDASGNYSLSNIFNGLYDLRLTTVYSYHGQVAGTPLLPNGWVAAGEGTTGTGDESADAKINGINVMLGTPVTNVNFGINRRPVTQSKAFLVANEALSTSPAGGPVVPGYRGVPLSSAALTGYSSGGSLAGSDAEDCAAAEACNSGQTFVIESINPNSKLFYDNQEVMPGNESATIGTLDASKLVLYGQVGTGETGDAVGFTYSLLDAAGTKSAAPGTFSLTGNAPFPVKLIAFSARVLEHDVELKWSTAQESASSHFQIQHSIDAKMWTTAGKVVSTGNSSVTQNYGFIHANQHTGNHFYRLKMVDHDSTFAFSGIRDVQVEGINNKIYPNPASSFVNVPAKNGEEIYIYDVKGVLRTKTRALNGRVSVEDLPGGTYLMKSADKALEKAGQKFVISR